MKADEWVKKNGWEKAKDVVALTKFSGWADHYNIKEDAIGTAGEIYSKKLCENNDDFVCLHDLKRLVESHELVEKYKNRHGGIRFRIRWGQYRYGDTQEYINRLKQAILDVESCQ